MVDQERRKVLQFGLAAVAVPLVGAAPARAEGPAPMAAAPAAEHLPEDTPPALLGDDAGLGPVALLAPHALGSELGMGWTFRDLRAADRGAMLLTLERATDGALARVHVCRNGGCPAGIASTDELDFLLMNGGRGDDASDEVLGRVLLRVANIARVNEAQVSLAGLLTHEERIEQWLGATQGVLQ